MGKLFYRSCQTTERQFESHVNQQYTEYVLERLAMISQSVSGIIQQIERERISDSLVGQQHSTVTLLDSLCELSDLLPQLANKWQEHSNNIEVRFLASRYHLPLQYSSQRGRPRLHIMKEQLEYLCSLSFSWSDISRVLGVSRMTIHRWRVEYGMIFEPSQSVNDDELMEILDQIRQELPDLGQSMLAGRLRAMGLHVTRERVREAIRRSDPINTALRWHNLTIRRPYPVPGPNSLWHIDGHHKLIRWGFVTHGGIDGYSRIFSVLPTTKLKLSFNYLKKLQ